MSAASRGACGALTSEASTEIRASDPTTIAAILATLAQRIWPSQRIAADNPDAPGGAPDPASGAGKPASEPPL